MTEGIERDSRSGRKELIVFAILAAVAFILFHLPYLPASLEDLDSINFGLGMRRFDVAAHQPHPPGYPVFVVLARGAHVLIHDEAKALATLGIVAGALGVLAIAAFFRRVDEQGRVWLPATFVAFTAPLYWFTASRPLSDMTGLAAAVGVQALIVGAAEARALATAALLAGLTAGIRSQVVWLTLPLLAWRTLRGGLERGASRERRVGGRFRGRVLSTAAAYLLGVLLWAVPLVMITGGPSAYWRAVSSQGAEDLSGIRMLWTTPTAREFVDALYYAFAAPWAVWPLAIAVVAFAIAGAAVLVRRHRHAALILAVAFGPYLAFDIVFQETFTSRYALPLVVPLAYLAAAGASALPRQLAVVAVALIAIGSAHVGGSTVAAYSRQKAPAFRLLDDMKATAAKTGEVPVLAFDRREALDLRRPIAWVGGAMVPTAARLPSPPQHEWLEVVKYWDAGGRAPVWFIADPLRADVRLFDHDDPSEYAWSLPYPVLMSGVRPNAMNWYRITSPRWYVGEGWALTPESAGVAAAEGLGPSRAPIRARVGSSPGEILIGGRNFSSEPATVRLENVVAGSHRLIGAISASPGFFAELVPFGSFEGWFDLVVSAPPRSHIAIEQFGATEPGRPPIVGFGAGWHEPEYDPGTGRLWRWMSERGELLVSRGTHAVHLEGESPRRYFSRGSRVVIRAAGQTAFDQVIDADFSITVPIPDARPVTISTDQTYTPAERSRFWRRSGDRRHLGLRIFRCDAR